MKVNVILITYNQEQYICQTLDSILTQKGNFEIEIIVADDASTDNTLSIIKDYTKHIPEHISFKFLPKENNLGFVKNYKRAFKACDGKYISILEGDDYWTAENHIDSHISFLESHNGFSMAYNRHIRCWVDENREEIFDWINENEYECVTTKQLALGNRIGTLSCCTFRTDYIKKIDESLFDMEIADWMLGMVMGEYGNIAYLKEVTSAYRIHSKGQWSKMTPREEGEKIIGLIDLYDKFLNYRYTKEFTQHKKRIEIILYGDKSIKAKIKKITPSFIRRIYRRIIK